MQDVELTVLQHIHETIQPVVHKETIQPNVVHTTVPIHEVHHNKATHHESTALPAMTMDEFKNKGGSLHGREERYDEFEGVPKNIGGGTAGGFGAVRDVHGGNVGGSEHHRHGDYNDAPNHRGVAAGAATGTAGPHGSNLANKADPRVDSDRDGRSGMHGTTGTAGAAGLGSATHGTTGSHVGTDGAIGNSHAKADTSSSLHDSELPKALTEDKSRFNPSTGHGHHDSNTSSSHKKPGLMDKLNPKKDTDGDGKAGIMD